MAKAEFAAPHTFVFAGAHFAALAMVFVIKNGSPSLGDVDKLLIGAVLGLLWSLLSASLYSLGCAWGGVTRPRRLGWALASGAAIALGLLIYAAIDRPVASPVNLEEAKAQYTRGIMHVVYTFLTPVLAGLISAWASKRGR